MKPSMKQIIALNVLGVLGCIEDIAAQGLLYHAGSKAWKAYWQGRDEERGRYSRLLYYLRTRGYIYDAVVGKEHYLELTNKGKNRLATLKLRQPYNHRSNGISGGAS